MFGLSPLRTAIPSLKCERDGCVRIFTIGFMSCRSECLPSGRADDVLFLATDFLTRIAEEEANRL